MSKIKMVTYRSRSGWLEHRTGIGGSDAASILGLNPWTTNLDIYNYKTGRDIPPDISKKEVVKFGHEAEASIRRLYALDHPEMKVEYKANNSWTNEDLPWAQASLDGWLTDKDGRFGILEIKTTEIMRDRDWDKWKGHIPQNYFCQTLHYMAVLEAQFVELRAYIRYHSQGEKRIAIRDYHIERTDVVEDIEFLIEKERDFWENHVEKKIPPALILPELK